MSRVVVRFQRSSLGVLGLESTGTVTDLKQIPFEHLLKLSNGFRDAPRFGIVGWRGQL